MTEDARVQADGARGETAPRRLEAGLFIAGLRALAPAHRSEAAAAADGAEKHGAFLLLVCLAGWH